MDFYRNEFRRGVNRGKLRAAFRCTRMLQHPFLEVLGHANIIIGIFIMPQGPLFWSVLPARAMHAHPGLPACEGVAWPVGLMSRRMNGAAVGVSEARAF